MRESSILLLIITLFTTSCETEPSVNGLWIVKSVSDGEQDRTPNARWVRFNADHTQESGNGWTQHSAGTWALDEKKKELVVNNLNGLKDESEPFKVTINGNIMRWNREEEGHSIEVKLERSSVLPQTYGDQLLGLWALEKAEGGSAYFADSVKENAKDYLFFKWDKKFVIGSESGRIRGVYNVHGHRPEVELIPYDTSFSRVSWKMEFEDKSIILSKRNTDSLVSRGFHRIHEFPQF